LPAPAKPERIIRWSGRLTPDSSMVEQSNESRVTLRPVVEGDEAFLLKVYAGTRADELTLIPWDETQKQAFVEMQFKAQSEHYRRSYASADNRIVLLNGRPAGRILVDRSEHEITLIDIALLTEHRRLGIGTRLIEELLDEAEGAAKPVRLHVLKSNRAFRLYERLGFSRVADDGVYLEMKWLPRSAES
jgi:ribosomal protein S18 acetylase RimI-like enzyme